MPIYEYTCQKCKKEFEKLVTGANPDVSCPGCKSSDIKKKFSLFGMSGVEKQVASGSGCSSCSSSSCSSCS